MKDQWENTGSVTSPVTHTELAAVNKASIKDVPVPSELETGSNSRRVPQRIEIRNPYARTRVAEKGLFPRRFSISSADRWDPHRS